MVLKQGGAAIHSSPDEEKNTKDEHEAVPQAIPIHPHDKEEEEDDDDECCFLAFVLTIKTWFASFDSQDYFEDIQHDHALIPYRKSRRRIIHVIAVSFIGIDKC